MTGTLLIQNGRLLDPGKKIDHIGCLLIRDGKISSIGDRNILPQNSRLDIISADGLVVYPGFIDLHCHLREPGFEEKETVATGARAAAQGGFTTICCMPNTRPSLDNIETINLIKSIAEKESIVRVLPIACVTKGRNGEELVDMELLAKDGVIGFSDDGNPVRTEQLLRRALLKSKELGLPVIDHCEDPIGGRPEGEMKIVARDLRLAEETGGWLHIAHVSVAGSVELIKKAKEKGVKVTTEVTPHHLTLTEETVKEHGTFAKVNPPLRTENDRQAMVRALKGGIIDIIATDHAPHTAADKKMEFSKAAPGISGFETAFGSLMSLVQTGQITVEEIIYRLTTTPSRILGNRHGWLGCLSVGATADIVVVDTEKEWVVDADKFASRGKNTPLDGVRFKGKVIATISCGKIIYADDSLHVQRNVVL